jgi:hypothetical protein
LDAPKARGYQNYGLEHGFRQRSVKTHGGAKLLRQVAHLRTTQQHIERPAQVAALASEQMVDHRFLRGCHRSIGQGRETAAYQAEVIRSWFLSAGNAQRNYARANKL